MFGTLTLQWRTYALRSEHFQFFADPPRDFLLLIVGYNELFAAKDRQNGIVFAFL
ncbi:MAG: hypothetical protein WBW53_16015 [Terriglobales bacterium]